jgi:ATP-binding cassette subfamily B protein/subfamily B ATP-binding cassette protein MsbA
MSVRPPSPPHLSGYVDVLAALGIAIVAGYGGYLVLQNQSHAWGGSGVFVVCSLLFRPIEALSQFYTTAQSAFGSRRAHI